MNSTESGKQSKDYSENRDNPKAIGKWTPDTDWRTLPKGNKVPRCHAHNRFGERCGNPCMRGMNVCRKHGGKAGAKAHVPQPSKVRHGLFRKLLSADDFLSYQTALKLDELEKLEHISALLFAKLTAFINKKGSETMDETEERALTAKLSELRKLSDTIEKIRKGRPKAKDDDITELF